jgi:hypothetical protein
MFEYNNKIFSLEMLEEKAKQKGLSLDEYLSAHPDIKKIEEKKDEPVKKEAVVDKAANATAVNEQIAAGQNTDLGSEDISLGLEKINKINQNFSKDTDGGVTSSNKPLDVDQAGDLTSYVDILAEDKKKLRKEKDVVYEIFMDKSLPRKYNELDEVQLNFLDQQAESVLVAPSTAEIKLKSIDLFNKAQKGIKNIEDETGTARFLEGLDKGAAYLGEAIASIPETLIDIAGLPLKGLVELGVLPENTATTSEELKKGLGVENPILDYFVAEQEKSTRQLDIYDKKRFKTTSPTDNFSNGDYYDGFVTMGNAIGESAGVSIAFMYGGATKGIAKTGKFMTTALTGTELRQQREQNPEQTELENITKSIALAGAESFFSAITQGSLGKVYKDIIFKQGKEAGEVTFKNGLIAMYESALKKYGVAIAPVGEGIEEVATQITQNAIEGYPLFQGIADAFVIGMGSGGVYGAPITVSQASQGVNNAITRTRISKILKDTPGPTNVKKTFQLFNKSNVTTEQQVKISSLKNADVILKQDLDTAVTNGEVTQNQANAILKNFYNTQGTTNRVKSLGIDGSLQTEAINLLKEKEVLEKAIKRGKSKPLADVKLGQVETINNRLREISKESSDLSKVKDVATTKKFAEGVGLAVVEANTEENQKALEEAAPEDFDINKDYGFISGKNIYLNNKVLDQLDNYEITTASHELLHGVLAKSLLDGDLNRKNIEEFVEKSYGKENLESLKKQMEEMGYDSDYLDSRPDEYLTQLYDANYLGEASAFEKAARFVERLIRKASGGKYNWSFATKDDLGSFLRSYKESFETGEVSKRLKDSKFFNSSEGTNIEAFSKATSEAASNKVQKIFDTKGKDGAIEIIEEFKPITNRIVQSRSQAPNFDRQLLTDEIETGKRGILDLISEYDASKGVPLAAYINQFLPSRAIEASKRVLGEEFTVDVTEARGVTDTTTEDKTEQVAEKPTKAKESLRKKIKLTDATSKKVVDAVVKTFGTKLPPADSKQFKQALLKAFRTELKTTIAKDVLGSRAAYETFLRDNFEAIIEALPQDVINKRFRPFAEDTGKREKTKEGKKIFKKKDITKAEFINYFLGRDVGTSTKGTRKDALAEALAQEFATDATMQTIQRPDVKEKREFVDKTQTTEKVSKAIDRSKSFKFSKEKQRKIRLFQTKDIFETSDLDFAANNEDWKVLSKIYGFGYINMKTAEGRKELLNNVVRSGLAAKLPKIFWLSFQGTTDSLITTKTKKELNLDKEERKTITTSDGSSLRTYGGNLPFKNVPEAEAWIKNAEQGKDIDGNPMLDENGKVIKIKFPEATPAIKQMLTREAYTYTEKGKSKNKLARDLNNSAFIKRQDQSLEGLKQVFDIFQTLITEDAATNIPSIIALLSSTSSNMNHFIRTSSPVRFYQKSFTGDKSKIREEHTLPASLVAKYLFIKATEEKINESWPNIERNFFQGALSVVNDNKLAGDGVNNEKYNYKEKTPPGWTMEDNIWGRYFNVNVANNDFGISPNEIMLGKNKSVFDVFPVNSAGYQIKPDFNKSIMAAASKNRSMLPKSVQPLEGVTNNEVLSEMKSLDNQANEARSALSKGKNLNKDFNDIIERSTGIGKEKRYGRTKARAVGAGKGKFDLLGIPPSAQDFVGLTRYFAGKGKQGDETIAWVKENFLDPFARANIDISNARVALANDFKALKKLLNVSPKDLNKKITGEPYNVGNAVRVYTWVQQGMTIPGLSKADQKILEDYVTADENLVTFANELIAINKDNGYPKPGEGWLAGTITTDLLTGLNTVVRAKYLKQWQNNVDEVFTETNMNKLEAAFGNGYRDALENMLGRMKTGSNRGFKGDTLTGRFVDWLNASVGAIMFFNMRSAVLQTISSVNFVNFTDNNIFKAAGAFANQPQYLRDVVKLMNSDYLVERRNGLKINVNEADIAEIAAESKNKAKALISKILKLGFLPTQIADSFAIASGGATFYRNRYNSLKKEGLSDKEADAQAFQDFREIAEESQQSSRPDRISKQQAGPLGRIILAFANTPAQYARLMQKAASDLKNRRGDDKTNISKIIYYGAVQNVIFNALQQALFAMAFSDEEPDEEKLDKKYTGIVNGMADSLLRGIGFHGAAISTLKNVIMKLAEGAEAQDAAIEMLDISPPVSSKIGKLRSAGRTWDWNKKEIMEKGWSFDNPAWLASGQVISAATNVPLDRGIRKLQNLRDASDAENEEWMRVANALGWQKWELDWQKDKIKNKSRTKSRKTSRTKSRTTKR